MKTGGGGVKGFGGLREYSEEEFVEKSVCFARTAEKDLEDEEKVKPHVFRLGKSKTGVAIFYCTYCLRCLEAP